MSVFLIFFNYFIIYYFSGTGKKALKNTEINKNINKNKNVDKNVCAVCSKSFKHFNTLNKHLRSHLLPKNLVIHPFKCEKCDKTFPKIQNMNTHRALIHGVLEM